ncbi:hypothetical protein CTH30272_03064 [Allocatenococcus thiocycli]|nr:hypothetical protein CTH30272_03064 [Catenococcus thiocycli]
MKAIDFYKDTIKGFEEMDFAQRRDAVDHEGIDNKKMHTKATLKALFRLKPSKNAVPAGSYINDYKNEINLYRIDQCVAMRSNARA